MSMAATAYEREIFRRRNMWVEFVVGSLPCSEMFCFWIHWFSLPLKDSNSFWNERTRLNEFLTTPKCSRGRLVPSRYLCVSGMREDWG